MEDLFEPRYKTEQITWDNNLIVHLNNKILAKKFLDFLGENTEYNFFVEFFEPDKINYIKDCIFAKIINVNFECNLDTPIDIRHLEGLKKILVVKHHNFLILPENVEIEILEK